MGNNSPKTMPWAPCRSEVDMICKQCLTRRCSHTIVGRGGTCPVFIRLWPAQSDKWIKRARGFARIELSETLRMVKPCQLQPPGPETRSSANGRIAANYHAQGNQSVSFVPVHVSQPPEPFGVTTTRICTSPSGHASNQHIVMIFHRRLPTPGKRGFTSGQFVLWLRFPVAPDLRSESLITSIDMAGKCLPKTRR